MGMRPLTQLEERIFNNGERLIPWATHNLAQLVLHKSSYEFFRLVIETDLRQASAAGRITIADLGCGVGHGCEALASIPGVQVLGAERSAECVEYARAHFGSAGDEFLVADLNDYVPGMSEFDYVVSRNVFEHIPGGLALAGKTRWRRRLLFDVSYDEQPGFNSHHVLWGIREDAFAGLPDAEVFFQDSLRGDFRRCGEAWIA